MFRFSTRNQAKRTRWCIFMKIYILEFKVLYESLNALSFEADPIISQECLSNSPWFSLCLNKMSWLLSLHLLKGNWVSDKSSFSRRRWIFKSALNVWFDFNFEEIYSSKGLLMTSSSFFLPYRLVKKGYTTEKRKLFIRFYFFLNIFNTRKCASLVCRLGAVNSINIRFIIFDCYVKREFNSLTKPIDFFLPVIVL